MGLKSNFAYLLVLCDDGKLDEVISQVQNLNNVKEIQKTCGKYDIVVKVESTTFENLKNSIFEKIKSLSYVKNLIILQCKPPFQ
jgi:uncharacterized protein YlbG (UPF0298 family)